MRLQLGTAQLRASYGKVTIGEKSIEHSINLLQSAIDNQIYHFDTAYDYKNAEKTIGIFQSKTKNDIKISSKLPFNLEEICSGKHPESVIIGIVFKILRRLKTKKIYCLLLHNQQNLNNKNIVNALLNLKTKGYVQKVGASVYDLEYAKIALEYNLDVLQLPLNIFNRTFLKFIEEHGNKIEISVRSIFLQGLFLIESDSKKELSKEIQTELNKFDYLSKRTNTPKLELAICFIKSIKNIESVVFGAETTAQLNSINDAFKLNCSEKSLDIMFKEFNDVQKEVFDPRQWKN